MGIQHSEEHRLLKPHAVRAPGARATFCRRRLADGAWSQQPVDLADLPQLATLALVEPEDGISYYLTQNTLRPGSWSRTLSSVMLLNACWVDIDLAHPPEKWAELYRPPSGDPASLAALLVRQIIDAGLPAPTYVVATGGGLAVKWLFTEPLPVVARARWQSTQTHLLDRIEQIVISPGVRWPVDRSASDAARVLRLVGTVNPKWQAPCWMAWDGGPEYEFNSLVDAVLPYTRAELEERRALAIQGKEWDANRARAAADGLRAAKRSVTTAAARPDAGMVEAMMDDEAARGLWVTRFEFARAVLAARGPIGKGVRNKYFWPLASALAWSCGGVETRLKRDLVLLYQDLFQGPGRTIDESMSSASTVVRRLYEPVGWGKGNYRFTAARWLRAFDITGEELMEHGHLLGQGGAGAPTPRKAGAMGMPPMKGLDYEDWFAETRRRQALGGAYAAARRSTTHSPEVRQRAIQMVATGMTTRQIAGELGISQRTAVRWTSSGG